MRASRHTFFALSLFFNCISAQTFSVQYPPTIVDEDSITQYIASSSFDGAKVTSVNASSYDWWYFDVVSLDHTYSAVVVFYTAPNTSFPFLPDGKNILAAQISLQTPDAGVLAFNTAYANAATLTVGGDDTDIQGDWEGVGAAFTGAENLTLYNVTFDAEEELGVTGFISFNSIAPSHYPCSTAEQGTKMEIVPHVGWANAIPDAHAVVELKVNGTHVAFSGSGYHDKNWGDVPFFDTVSSWYWGHARVGPYSLVWFDTIIPNGTEYASGYISQDGQIIGVACGTDKVSVRPVGNTTYPPHVGSNPQGFEIKVDLGEEDRGVFEAVVTAETFVLQRETGLYSRWTGGISGGFQNDEQRYNGTSLFEQFTLTP